MNFLLKIINTLLQLSCLPQHRSPTTSILHTPFHFIFCLNQLTLSNPSISLILNLKILLSILIPLFCQTFVRVFFGEIGIRCVLMKSFLTWISAHLLGGFAVGTDSDDGLLDFLEVLEVLGAIELFGLFHDCSICI